jgi:hypothetical protein
VGCGRWSQKGEGEEMSKETRAEIRRMVIVLVLGVVGLANKTPAVAVGLTLATVFLGLWWIFSGDIK